ncbi:unnamed protein product [Chrysodeixis includens]|uniref:Uncharacterized protein n=1 Tax=Chrysodeixis includens TaxID=689277 RepID=A0A9P0FRT0_CHRIL|nr:unnamed protein product [Chrysodeixis includens]
MGDGSQGTAAFWVGNYELPPFQLSVRHAPRVLRTSDRLVWTVCVRYPWSEAVEGMLVIRLRGAGGGSMGIRTAVQLKAPKACHRHATAAKRVGLDGPNPPDVVVADFSFQERGTRIWQNTTVVSQVVDKAISLEFLTKHRAVISARLPMKLKVKATRWDDKPASGELVRVCRYPWMETNEERLDTQKAQRSADALCAESATDASGVASLFFAAGDYAAPLYRFEASLSNDSTISAAPLSLPVRHSGVVHAALGPLRAESGQARINVPLYLHANITTPFTVHFVVVTRGGIIQRWGATTQCPSFSSADQVRVTARNSICNTSLQHDVVMAQRYYNEGTDKYKRNINGPSSVNKVNYDGTQKEVLNTTSELSDALLDRHQLRVMLPIKMCHQMCPDSHLIAYFYYKGELVSASKHFEMNECFANKVEATWVNRHALPGSTVALKISTPGPALCALTVLDSASKWAQPPPTVKDQLMTSLRRLIDSHRNLTEYDAAGECFLNVDSPEIPSSSIELTSTWLAQAGLRLIGGETPSPNRCKSKPPASLVTDEATIPRSDFSEAWLWRLLPVSMSGSGVATARAPDSISRFEASAVCLSRNSLAVSTPAVLQVFREFFIHADSPKRLRRGDSSIIRYRIFNYLYEPLSIQIQILTDPNVEGPKELVETACVNARSSIARSAEIKARVAAPARVSIRAKAVSDGNCGNVTSGKTGVSDEVILHITIDPEGVPIQDQRSILLCGNDKSNGELSEVIWEFPKVQAAPGTETLTVWAVGDVTGPLLADADSLLMIPRGCGEQNMAQLATNLLALEQLEPSSIAALTAREHVARGFTRQLQYVHPSGGFSAFGPSDAVSSTWLTAFAVRHLRRAHQFLWPNLQVPSAIIRAERWLLNQQMENGCFRNEGQVFHRELRGGLNDDGEVASVALTAYVITSLIESTSPLPYRVIQSTLSCLRAFPPLKAKTHTRVYAQALLTYAYMKLRVYEEELMRSNEASLMKRRNVWEIEQDEGIRQLLELLKLARRSEGYVWWEASSLSTSIEATAYALLALHSAPAKLSNHGQRDAPATARWLAAHRGAGGGFVSTQDTLVALEALTAWSSNTSNTRLNVTASCGQQAQSAMLRPGVKIPDVMKLKPGDALTVTVEGKGCALVQATRAYNSLATENAFQEKPLSVQVSVHTDGPFNCDHNGTSCFCAAIVEACVMWSGSFPEMALLEVHLPGGFGADAQLLYSQLNKEDTLLRRIEVTASNSRASLYLGSRDGSAVRARAGHACWSLHAAGPRAHTKPAYVRVHDYYVPSHNDTQVYTIPEECPARIAEVSNQYSAVDNLFTKARALDSEEILITHDFSFEDIPEGIPLEDPLFDNMTRKEKDKIIMGVNDDIGRLEKHIENLKLTMQPTQDHRDSEIIVDETKMNKKTDEEESDPMRAEESRGGTVIDDAGAEVKEKDESKFDTRNNIVHEIDSLNNVAHQLFNETQAKYDFAFLDPKNIYGDEDENSDINVYHKNYDPFSHNHNLNTDNVAESLPTIIEEERPKETDLRRSFTDETTISQPINAKVDKEETKTETHLKLDKQEPVENPGLSNFHVIDSDKDLEVPSGVEGPVPTVVLPPPDFIPPSLAPTSDSRKLQYKHMHTYTHSPSAKESVSDVVFQPQHYINQAIQRVDTRRNRIASEPGMFGIEGPVADIVLPTMNFNLPPPLINANFRNQHALYRSHQGPSTFEGPISTIVLPPQPFHPRLSDGDLRGLQGIYTAHGPYYYFKEDENTLSKKLFIPLG